jgi:hypothetical protein
MEGRVALPTKRRIKMDRKIMVYSIAENISLIALENWVNDKIGEGWQPFGNVFRDASGRRWHQPMVKYDSVAQLETNPGREWGMEG